MKFRLFLMSVAVVVSVMVALANVRAQSISDLDLGGLERLSPDQETRTHTNPFATSASAAEDLAVEDLQLTGIVWRDDNNSYALISGYLVRPGDKIAGFRVDKIEADKVRLRRIDEVIVLALGGGI